MATATSLDSTSNQVPLRAPIPIPPTLRDTLKILFEEELFLPGINLLNNLLAQGISRTPNSTKDGSIFMPPPIYISLLTTILAHPHFTTHIPKKSRADNDIFILPTHAERVILRYFVLAGAHGAGILDAWRFAGEGGSRRRRRDESVGAGGNSEVFDDNKLDLELAQKESVFGRAEDFWAVIGWGFTCACADRNAKGREKWMGRRWEEAWKRWIRVVVEGLERDWVERREVEDRLGDQCGGKGRKGALVLRYLPDTRGSAGVRRVVRAIFANGRGRMAGEWKEVWKGETEGRSQGRVKIVQQKAVKRKAKNGVWKGGSEEENDQGGELKNPFLDESDDNSLSGTSEDDDEEGGQSEGESISVGATSVAPESFDNAADSWGGVEAVTLRRRIMLLLLDVCSKNHFPLDTLHDAIGDLIIPLSLPEFSLFTTATTTLYTSHSSMHTLVYKPNQRMLNHFLLGELMESEAPLPSDECKDLDLNELVICYLPYGAKSGRPVDNTKVGLLVESLLRDLLVDGGIQGVNGKLVVEALEKGIGRRIQGKRKGTTPGRGGEEARVASRWSESVEGRLKKIVEAWWGKE